jgi:hypothetical protein
MKTHIITIATNSELYFPYLVDSCKKNGIPLTVLGYGEKWTGFTFRFDKMIQYLKKLDPNDVVCFIDGYDVICVRNLNEMTDVFLQLKKKNNCKIVIAENNIIMNNLYNVVLYITVKTSFDKCKNKLINAGSYIGQVKDILYVLEQIYTGDNTLDDQKILVKYCKSNPNDIYIDLKNELFLTIDRPFDSIHPYLTVKNNKIYYNNNRPFFIHGNGHTYLDSTLDLIGYKNVNINHKLYYKNKNKYFISTYFNEICYVSIYIIIFIVLFIYIMVKKYK